MYRIINIETGEVIGSTTELICIRRKPSSGALIKATPADAQSIAYKSTPYNLIGRNGVGVDVIVSVSEFDGTEELANLGSKTEFIKKTIGGSRADRMYEAGECLLVDDVLYNCSETTFLCGISFYNTYPLDSYYIASLTEIR